MRPYGKTHIGGLCRYSCRCGEEAPRGHTPPASQRTLKRRARAAARRAISREARVEKETE